MNMRDRLAQALWEAGFQEPWADVDMHTRQLTADQVDAILDAMREPSDDAVAAGSDSAGISEFEAHESFKAMIDSIKAGR